MFRVHLAVLLLTLAPSQAVAGPHRGCGKFSGRDYVICKESGLENMPDGLPPGTPHPGPSSAAGPCGMTRDARADYGGDSLAACTRYMLGRYGTWADAESWHRRKNWW